MFTINRRGAGVAFCFISALLFISRYISAALFSSNVSSWSAELFQYMLQYTGNTLVVLSVVSLAVGVTYLVLAEREK